MFASALVETQTFPHRLLVPVGPCSSVTSDLSCLRWKFSCEVVLRGDGEGDEEYVEIRSGLSPGDTVIVDGHYTLAHDAKVSVLTEFNRRGEGDATLVHRRPTPRHNPDVHGRARNARVVAVTTLSVDFLPAIDIPKLIVQTSCRIPRPKKWNTLLPNRSNPLSAPLLG